MKCRLQNQIDHEGIKQQFRRAYIECPLLAHKNVGMSSVGTVCGGCCLRIQQLLEARKDLVLRQIVSTEDCKRNPEIIMEYLPDHLKMYYHVLQQLGKTMNDVLSECTRCDREPVGTKPIYASEAIEMTQCGRNDWR